MMENEIQFSPREKQVIELLLQGRSNKEMALALGVSVRAVEFRLSNIYAKLAVASRTEAALKLSEMRLGESTSADLRESAGSAASETTDNEGNLPWWRLLVKRPLLLLGGIGVVIALILTLLSIFLVLNGPVRGVEFETIATAGTPPEMLSTAAAAGTLPGPLMAPQPTPPNVLAGGTVHDGHFVFDLRLYRDPRFGQHPVTPSLYSDMEGIAAWMYWVYAGADTLGPVETYWGTLPQLEPLPQETYPSVQLGSSGGRNGGVMLLGGFYISGKSKPGDRVHMALKVVTPGGEYGAVLAFTLKQGPNGFEPSNVLVDTLQQATQSFLVVETSMIARNGPGTEFDVTGQVAPETRYPVIGKYVDWWLVDMGNDRSGWVYAATNMTTFAGNAGTVPDIGPPPTPTLQAIPACTPANAVGTAAGGLQEAQSTLLSFFEFLDQRDYQSAAGLYAGDYRDLQYMNILVDPQDHAFLLKNGCELNGLQCLRVKRIVDARAVSSAEYRFTVEFMNQDGNLFVIGPCCGGNATDFPLQSQFAYTVIRSCDGELLITALPPYVP